MLLRLIAENLTSFKEAIEFNTFPSSKSHSHENHKIECGHATVLRLSAIYGANGACKSNLLVILNFLKGLVEVGSIRDVEFFDALYEEGTCPQVHYVPVYRHPYYENLGYKKGLCPVAEEIYETTMSIPFYASLSDEEVNDTIKAVKKVCAYYRK